MMNVLTIAGINMTADIFSGIQEFLDPSEYQMHSTPLEDVCHDEEHWRRSLDTDSPWVIIGQGAGALLAVELAQISDNVAGVLTLSMDVTGHAAIYRPALRFLSRFRTSLPAAKATSSSLDPAEVARYFKSSHISITTLLAFNHRSSEALEELRRLWIPVMNIYGAEDLSSVVQSGQLLKVAGYASVCMQNCGHMGLIEDPKAYAKIIEQFLSHVSDIDGNVTKVPSLFFKMMRS